MKKYLTSLTMLILLGGGLLASCAPVTPAAPATSASPPTQIPATIPPPPPPAAPPSQAPVTTETPQATPISRLEAGGTLLPTPNPADVPAAVWAGIKALAEKLNVPQSEITIMAYDQVEWTDGCLGITTGKGQMCTQVIIPGYIMQLVYKERIYEVHSDDSGKMVVIAP